jgi:hypothetical protein
VIAENVIWIDENCVHLHNEITTMKPAMWNKLMSERRERRAGT